MGDINSLLRRSVVVDTSGSEPPRGIQMIAAMGGGVYTQAQDTADSEQQLLVGRISLGILAVFVLGAVGILCLD